MTKPTYPRCCSQELLGEVAEESVQPEEVEFSFPIMLQGCLHRFNISLVLICCHHFDISLVLFCQHEDVISEEEREQRDFMRQLETGEFEGVGTVQELDTFTFGECVISNNLECPLILLSYDYFDDRDSFIRQHSAQHEVVFVDFFAPWCIWCQRLQPAFAQLAEKVGSGGPIWLGKVDCTAPKNEDLCVAQHVRAFPTLLFFRHGDEHPFEAYHGKRTSDGMLRR